MSMSFYKFALDKLFKQFVKSNKRFPSPTEKKQLEDRAIVEAMAARKKEQAESGIETLDDLMNKLEGEGGIKRNIRLFSYNNVGCIQSRPRWSRSLDIT